MKTFTLINLSLSFLFLSSFFPLSLKAQPFTYTVSGPTRGSGPLLNTEPIGYQTVWDTIHPYNAYGGASTNSWSSAQSIGFPFSFYGSPATHFCVSKNYLLTFDTTVAGTTVNSSITIDNTALPNANLPDHAIAYFWGGFGNPPPLGSNDAVQMKIFGTTPNRQLWIRNYSYEFEAQDWSYNFVVLEETTHKIYVVIGTCSYQGVGSYTVGVQLNSTTAVQHPNSPNISSINGSFSIPWSSVSYYEFTPRLLVNDDAGILSLDAPTSLLAPGSQSVQVSIKNHGINNLDSVRVNWSVDGVAQASHSWTGGSLAPGAVAAAVNIGSYNFTLGNPTLKIWTSNPNGNPDNNTSNDTLEVSLVVCNLLSGAYTLGGTSSDFPNFNSLATLLSNCGVSGPVIIKVAPGTYAEQFTLGNIAGVSQSNTIVIDGGDNSLARLTHDSSTTSNATVAFDSTSYVSLRNMTLENTKSSTDAWVVHLQNTDYIVIDSCLIEQPVNTTSDRGGIVGSGSLTSAFTITTNKHLTVSDNIITGGYHGISLEGNTSDEDVGNYILRNRFIDIYYYGIRVNEQDSLIISGNVIENTNSSGASDIYCLNITDFEIRANNLLDCGDEGIVISGGSSSGTARSLIANNMIYAPDAAIRMSGTNSNVNIYHNTAVGLPAMQFTGSNHSDMSLYNNIFSSPSGVALDASVSLPSTIDIDYNLYQYQLSGNIARDGSTYANLAAWQAAKPALNQNSVEGNPLFVKATSPADLHLIGALANDIGDNSVGIHVDIDGDSRPLSPSTKVDIGADEYHPATCLPSSGLSTSAIGQTTAQLSWAMGGASNWNIEYGLQGFIPGSGAFVYNVLNPYILTGLNPSTNYDFYVQDSCGIGDVSIWRGPFSFATLCPSLSAATLPIVEDFEFGFSDSIFQQNQDVLCASTYKWSYETSLASDGRLRFAVPGFANNGSSAATLDRVLSGGTVTNYLILTADLSSYSSSSTLGLEFSYMHHSEENHPNDRVWIRGSNTNAWVEIYDLHANQGRAAGIYNQVIGLDIDSTLANAIPPQRVSSTFQVRFGQEDTNPANSPTGTDGHSFDDITIREVSCPYPSSLMASNITDSSATLSWTTGGASNWNLEYGKAGFTPGTGNFLYNVSNPHILSGLSPATDYEFYVQDSCGVDTVSRWTGPVFFPTSCAPFTLSAATLPIVEDFESASGTYQRNRNVLCYPTYKWSYETSFADEGRLRFAVSGFANNGNSAATLDKSISTPSLVTNYLILTADLSHYSSSSILELEFSYMHHGGSSHPNDKVWIRGSNTDSWVQIYDLYANLVVGIYNWVIDLDIDAILANATPPQRVSSTFQLRFGQEGDAGAQSTTASDGYSFDDIAIREVWCPRSSSLTANTIGPDTASVSWTGGGGGNVWIIEWGAAGFTQGSGTLDTITTNSYTLKGLTPFTTYDFYVRDSCFRSGNSLSFWTFPISFTTLCSSLSPATLPLIEDFESLSGTFQQDTGMFCNSTYTWSYETSLASTGRLRFAVPGFANNGSSAATLDRVLAGSAVINYLILTADLSHYSSSNALELEFSYMHHGEEDHPNDRVWIRSSNTDAWVEIYDLYTNQGPLGIYNQVIGLDIDSILANATPPQRVSSTFQVRFGQEDTNPATSPTSADGYSFDDIAIRETCPSPTNLTATNITQTSATLSWVAGGASNWDLEYGLSGFTPGSGTQIHTTIPSYTVSGLTSGMGYDFYVRSTCGLGYASSWAGPYTFTTLSATLPCPSPSSLGATHITQTNARLSWMSGGISTFNWNLEWGTVNFALGSGNFLPNVAPTHYTLRGLIPGTSYQFYVRDSCGAAHVSSWAGPYTFTTLSTSLPCPSPSSLLATQITQNSARLSWVTGGASNWDLEYGLSGFTLGSGTQISTTTPSYTVSGLTPGQSYQFYVRNSCGVSHVSSWTGSHAFVTLSATLPCPSPSSLLATQITQTSARLSWVTGGASNWDLEYGLSGFTLGSGTRISTTTPSYAVSGLTPGQSYQFYVRDSCGVGHVSSWAGPDAFTTLSATLPCPSPSSLLATQITQNSARLSWVTGGASNWGLEYGLSGFTLGSGTQISTTIPFYTVSGLTPGTDYDFYVRDSCGAAHVSSWAGPYTFITLSATLPCPSPSSLLATQITQNSARLWWMSGGTSTSNWGLEYGLSGFTLGSGTQISTTTPSYTVSGLTPGRSYQFYVRDSCGVGHVSSWVGPHTFRTLGCLAPTGLKLDIITEITATVSWTSGGASNWNIEYGPINFPLGSGIFLYNVSSPRILRGLMPNTFYDVYVQDSCNVGNVSNWVGPLSIKTVIGIDELLERSFRIYPNPSEGAFNLEFSSSLGEDMEIRITNMMGQIVLEDEIESFSGSYRKRLEMGAYRSGVYLLQLITEKATVNRRIILQ